MPEVVGGRVIGDEKVDQAILVEVRGDDAQAPPVGVDDAGIRRDVDKPAAIVAEQMIGPRGKRVGHAILVEMAGIDRLAWPARTLADVRVMGVPDEVVADVKIEVAVVVEIGERGRGGPVAIIPRGRRDL